MKKIFYLLACLTIFVSCKKDETLTAEQRRIKEVNISNQANVGTTKIFYDYDNDLLVKRTVIVKSSSSYDTWDTTLKSNYTYSDNLVTEVSYLGEEGQLNLGRKTEYKFTGTRMDGMKSYNYVNDQWKVSEEYVFNYNGDLLSVVNYYSDVNDNGVLLGISTGEYLYNDNLIVKFKLKDVYYNAYFYEEEFVYENGVLDYWYSSDDYKLTNYWRNREKESYEYNSDNVLTKTRTFEWNNAWSFNYTITYEYDRKNLVKKDYGVGKLQVDYIYEEEKGNSEQLIFNPMDRVYNHPIIEDIYNKPYPINSKYEINSE